jgi:hypothetical protein
LALALGTALATAAGWFAWRSLRAPTAPVDFDRRAIADLLARRSATPAPPAIAATGAPRRAEDRAWYVPSADAALLFAVKMRGSQYDPWCYHAHKPGFELKTPWAEHPNGHWTYRTNSIGLREDDEVRGARPDLRVLVTGDSHTDGFCDNADNYTNRLESSLARRFASKSIEVLNAADLAYSFYSYFGVLEKFVHLEPGLFVVAVHGGNDFLEALVPYRYFAREPLPPELIDEGLRAAAGRQDEIFIPASYQGLLSIAYFRRHPEEKAVALRAALEVFTEIQRTCAEHGIALICLYLPSPIEIERTRHADLIEPTMQALGLDEEDVESHAEIGRTLMRELEARGIAVLDTGADLRAAQASCFWRQDLHLNLLGHATVARALEPLVARVADLRE